MVYVSKSNNINHDALTCGDAYNVCDAPFKICSIQVFYCVAASIVYTVN